MVGARPTVVAGVVTSVVGSRPMGGCWHAGLCCARAGRLTQALWLQSVA
jgi:hypothetical protein